jgi:hypothetical protein
MESDADSQSEAQKHTDPTVSDQQHCKTMLLAIKRLLKFSLF